MKGILKIARIGFRIFLIALISLCILELIYRFQWIDFYKKEWKYHNSAVQKGEQSLLIFGDSFSADPNGWVGLLRDSMPNCAIYNAALPGIGPETYRMLMRNRIDQTKPDRVIVQLYVGNDLYDYEKPVNWSVHSFSRNVFWSSANRFRVLNYLNYRLGQSSVEDHATVSAKEQTEFDGASYSKRTKLYIKGDKSYPKNMIEIADAEQFNALIDALQEMKETLHAESKFSVLVIPHCTQISEEYLRNYGQLGASTDHSMVGNEAWETRLRAAGFDVLAPRSLFQELEAAGEAVYFPNDPHLSENGQRVLSNFVHQTIQQ